MAFVWLNPTKSLQPFPWLREVKTEHKTQRPNPTKTEKGNVPTPPTLPLCIIWVVSVWMCPTLTVLQKKKRAWRRIVLVIRYIFFMLLLKLSERKSTLKYVLSLFYFSQCVCWCAWARLSASPKRRSRLWDDNGSVRGSSTLAVKREGLRDFFFVVSSPFPGAFSQRGLAPFYKGIKCEVENGGKGFVVCFYFSPHWFFFPKPVSAYFSCGTFRSWFWAARKMQQPKC